MAYDERYIAIPYPILMNKTLTDKAKMLFGLIKGFWDGDFKASNEWIARTLCTTPRTVQRALTELINANLVLRTIVLKDGRVVGKILRIKKGKTKVEPKADDEAW